MPAVVWLVDYENVQEIGKSHLPRDVQVKVFVGTKQSRLPTELVKLREERKDGFEWIWIEGSASNALHFHIACHLGECLVQSPQSEFVILSNDKGFDPLVMHLKSRGIKCRRQGQGSATRAPTKPAPAAPEAQVLEHLRKINKGNLPRKRKTLVNHLKAHFKKKLTEAQVSAAIDQLVKRKQLQESATGLVYQLA